MMTLGQWRATLAELKRATTTHKGKIPLTIAAGILDATSRPVLYRRLREINDAGFWLRVHQDTLIVEQWATWDDCELSSLSPTPTSN